jgi:hypothetical protein
MYLLLKHFFISIVPSAERWKGPSFLRPLILKMNYAITLLHSNKENANVSKESQPANSRLAL